MVLFEYLTCIRWVKVKILDMSRVTLPDLCPNCLGPDAAQHVKVYRSYGIPFVASFSLEAEWDFCDHCAASIRRGRRMRWLIGYGPALLMLIVGIAMAVINANSNTPKLPTAIFILLAVGFGLFGTLSAILWHKFGTRGPGQIANGTTVKPVKVLQSFTGKIKGIELRFANPIYVEQLISANDPEIIRTNPKRPAKAIQRFESKHSGT